MKEQIKSYSGKYDHVFLSLVTFDNDYLKEIIYEVLGIKVNTARIINSKMAKKRLMSRANYLDLVVETEDGYMNIEVSNDSYNKYSAHRNFIYLTNLINNVTKIGMKLREMPKVIQINLIFGQEQKKYDISNYNIYSKKERKILTKKFEIININVDNLKEMYYNDNNKLTNKPALVALAMTKEELEERKEENMFYKKLLDKLDEMEDTGIAPEIMPIEEENKWYREMLIESAKEDGMELGIEQGIEQGIERGIQENRTNVIHNMLKEKMDINLIAKVTEVSPEYIKNISQSI